MAHWGHAPGQFRGRGVTLPGSWRGNCSDVARGKSRARITGRRFQAALAPAIFSLRAAGDNIAEFAADIERRTIWLQLNPAVKTYENLCSTFRTSCQTASGVDLYQDIIGRVLP